MSRSLPLALSIMLTAGHAYADSGGRFEVSTAGLKGLGRTAIQSKSIADSSGWGASLAYHVKDVNLRNCWWQLWTQASYSELRGEHYDGTEAQDIAEIKALMRWYPDNSFNGYFAEFGLGGAHLSNTEYNDIPLDTNLNFAVQFSGGYRWSNGLMFSLRYSHFSNAFTNEPNPGLDFAGANLHFSF